MLQTFFDLVISQGMACILMQEVVLWLVGSLSLLEVASMNLLSQTLPLMFIFHIAFFAPIFHLFELPGAQKLMMVP